MKLIVFSGLPGTGKSKLAEAVGSELGIPVFAKDWLEAGLLRSRLTVSDENSSLGATSYDLLTMLAERQMSLHQSVILDSVASTESIRSTWREICRKYHAEWRVVECICSDESVHRERLTIRQRNIPGWHELEWAEVERVRTYYVTWNEKRLIVDSIQSFDSNLVAVLEYCR